MNPETEKDLPMTEKSDILAELLKEEIRLFRNFLSLTESLKEMLKRGDPFRIGDILRKRRGSIDRIDRLDGRIRELKRDDAPGRFPALERRLGSLFLELEEVMKAAVRMDRECTEGARKRLESIRAELSALSAGRQGFRGGLDRSARRPRFLDVKT